MGNEILKTAWIFPGQGSQYIGMLDDLPTELVESFRSLALEALSFDIIDLIKNGNEEDLNKFFERGTNQDVVEAIRKDEASFLAGEKTIMYRVD